MRDWSWLHSTGSYESFSIPLDTLGLSCQSTQFPRGTQQERHAAALQGGVVALYARQPEDGVILHLPQRRQAMIVSMNWDERSERN